MLLAQVPNTLQLGDYLFTIIGVCITSVGLVVGLIWKAASLTNDVKSLSSKTIELLATDVQHKTLIEAQSLRLSILETRSSTFQSDLHDMKEMLQKIYDKIYLER
ncbi:MAG TPA: hypothetical protein VKR58_05885 [Aquella sp.]|nr:hypothetical protein [Aquella sp.]